MLVDHRILRAMLDTVGEGVYHTDAERRILHWNSGSGRITGHRAEAVTGCRCQDRIVRHVDARGRELCSTSRCPLLVPQRTGKDHEADLFLHHREGHLIPVRTITRPHRDPEGRLIGLTQVFSPRTGGHDWRREALTDALTGVGNRRAFRLGWGRLHRSLLRKGSTFGVLLVDIDRFKAVNDTWGHGVGDRVLKMVARTLAGCVRPGDAVVRWGGEEFLVLVPEADSGVLADLAERMRQLVERSWVVVGDEHLGVTVSVGGSLVRPGDRPSDLVARADQRLFDCKNSGRNRSSTGD